MTAYPQGLLDQAIAGDPVALTRALVRTPSVNPSLEADGTGEAEIAALTAGWLREWGFELEVEEPVSGRPNVLARSRGGAPGPTLLLNGHLDTVGIQGMTVDPFGAELMEDRIHGRGSCDMKAGIGALLSAARQARLSGHSGDLVVALTSDEEHASLGMQDLVASGVRADAAIVCEPTSLAVMPANKGFIWVDLAFAGHAAHGSRPSEGRDAIMHAARYMAALTDLEADLLNRSPHPLLDHGTFHAGTISGGSAPSVYPAECLVTLERRTLPGESDAEVMEEFRAIARAVETEVPGLSMEIRQGLTRPATEIPDSHPLVAGLQEARLREGLTGGTRGMTAWVDAALLNEVGVPAVCFGPGSIGKAHSADEWVPVDEVVAAAEVLARFVEDYLPG